MVSAQQAPPVVAVMVTCDPGPWLEEALKALAEQDYPNLSVLIVDAASAQDPTPRVAAVLPGAFVRRLPANTGYAAAANVALEAVEGSCHLLFCHDDVAPEPDAVRLLVEEAFRSNAAVVAPKLVDWEDPSRLLQVGMGADKSGAPAQLVDRGELDQEQHDGVRDVFVAPGGCTLVRADLFRSLGGFDSEMFLYGEDLDLSWRAQVAGARVIVAPAARVRHLEAMSSGQRAPGGGPPPPNLAFLRRQVRPYQLRHRLRAVLKSYGFWHLVRVLPQVLLLAAVEVLFGLLSGHTRTAGDTARAWTWNMKRLGELRQARRAVHKYRGMGDAEVRRLQARGSARFSGFVRGQLASERVRRTRGVLRTHIVMRPEPSGHSRLPLAVAAAVAFVLLVGSRHLLTGGLPAVHELSPFPGGTFAFLRSFLTGWRQTGLGSDAPAPLALGLLGIGGVFVAGSGGLLQTVLVLGSLPVGAVGALRLATPFGSRRARTAAMLVYLAIPLPYNAIARGRWGALLVYAAIPWLLARLLRVTAIAPVADRVTRAGVDRRSQHRGDGDRRSHPSGPGDAGPPGERLDGQWARRHLLPLGMLLALVAAFVPAVVVVLLVVAVALLLGSLLAGDAGQATRAVLAAAGAVVVATVLLFPWSLDFLLPDTRLSSLMGVDRPAATAAGLGTLLRFETGPLGAAPLGWAFLAAAALPLLLGRSWRLAWATRMWTIALVCWGLAWSGGRGWLPVEFLPPDVLLAPAALAMAVSVALGMVAFELDLPGYRFGWRHLASTTALVATVAGTLPVAAAAVGGRWNAPRADFSGLLSWMPEQRSKGAFRVLWMGHPEALPLGSWRLSEGVGYATSKDGPPDATLLWAGGSPGAAELVADAVGLARRSGTTSLGHLLAPTAIRYLVVPLRAAPTPADAPLLLPPPDLRLALDAQVDLKKIDGDSSLLVYENAAWAPGRASLDALGAEVSTRFGLADLRDVDLAGSPPVLPRQRSLTRFSGPLTGTDHVLLSEAASSNWQLKVAGRAAPRSKAFGWANAFSSPASGEATLRYRTPLVRHVAVLAGMAAWFLVGREIVRARRRRRWAP
ncbi:MAG TPA: glycosyltransferase family 2 protein [Acidimicrobiales bacterium]|nr:glycosyltransferase family 2 protein [Acidimicrobiales bacterium]